MSYELKFDPKTIEHLGVKMYSTLPPALAELISNSYDADASNVTISFHEQNNNPISITIMDDGSGMSAEDIQNKFLVIGRNRREKDGDEPSKNHKRLPTGKKGLGKLALFGLAKTITVDTVKDGLRNRFILDWDQLLTSEGVYSPTSEVADEETEKANGTTIKLSDLKRKSPFDIEGLADSLSKIFIIDSSFAIKLKTTDGKESIVDNERRYSKIESQFQWSESDLIAPDSEYFSKITLNLITSKSPIPPNSGLRGITLFSRGKLVNAAEYFASSTSSHFFQYLTGWIKADFIDLLDEDVISTNRQSINWDNPEMENFKQFLSDLILKAGREWRDKRSEKKEDDFKTNTGIDKEKWLSTMPDTIKKSMEKIIETMSKDEEVSSTYSPVIKALYDIVPEYPELHWRHLHSEIQNASRKGYESADYYSAFLEAAKRYANRVREYTGNNNERDIDLMGNVFGPEDSKWKVAEGYFRKNKTKFAVDTLKNIEGAQRKLSQGVFEGGRNVVAHEEVIDLSFSGLFSEKDCLDLLSLISHLMCRVEEANKKKNHNNNQNQA